MVHLFTDDTLVESKLHDLINLTKQNGASFHNEIEIISKNGEMRIDSRLGRSNSEPLIYLPDSCLPRIDDFDVGLDGNDLTFKPRSNKVNNLHAELFGMILELFNLTGKIETHRKTFPWLVFANSVNILECLHKGRSVSDKYYDYFKSGDLDRLTIETFLGARYVNHPYQGGHGIKSALMPIIDCLNHHSFAKGYLHGSPNPMIEKGLLVRNSKPLDNSDECFVRYNKADSLSAYMSYGFVDSSAVMMRSIPLTLDLSEAGIIYVHTYTFPMNAEHIPPVFEDIKYFFPTVRRTGKKELQVSHLMIPPDNAARSLRRILEFLVMTLSPELLKKELKRLVRKCEMQILNENFNYYDRLQDLLNTQRNKDVSANSVAVLNQLIQGQQEKLNSYKERRL